MLQLWLLIRDGCRRGDIVRQRSKKKKKFAIVTKNSLLHGRLALGCSNFFVQSYECEAFEAICARVRALARQRSVLQFLLCFRGQLGHWAIV